MRSRTIARCGLSVKMARTGKTLRRLAKRLRLLARAEADGLWDAVQDICEVFGVRNYHAVKVLTKGRITVEM